VTTRRKRALFFAALSLGIVFDVTAASMLPSGATVHVVSNSECSKGNVAKSQNPPGQSDPAKRSFLAAARHSPHRDPVEEC
jgi:hypothetical protein